MIESLTTCPRKAQHYLKVKLFPARGSSGSSRGKKAAAIDNCEGINNQMNMYFLTNPLKTHFSLSERVNVMTAALKPRPPWLIKMFVSK